MNFALVPVKALAWGKSRLSSYLSPAARHALSRAMLTDVLTSVLHASAVDRVVVVTSDAMLLTLARQLGALVVDEEYPRGLNGAVAIGTEFCLLRGATTLLVLLADLPLVTAADVDLLFRQLSGDPEVILVPCKEGEGTNALLRVPPLVIAPCFGGPSLEAYQTVARRQGVTCRVVEVPGIAFDLDSVEDLERFAAQATETRTYHMLQELGVVSGAAPKV
ncbi:MAG: 2-phospho-L-lactate guanylyltransferase [Deltaproteobacteria bacterium]|nr:2-phospho-L-lactate guanylyltransferase [Deltaproteobacteria bacterium]